MHPDISTTEQEIMTVLWQQSPMNAQQIIEQLNQQKPWHEKTVKTLLNRLVKKGALGFEKQQRAYCYFPLIDQQSYQQAQSSSFIERLFGGRVSPLIAGFAKQNKLSAQDVAELKQFIEQWEQNQDD